MVALGYGFYFHMDKLPGGLQLWLQQWLSKEHERPATTSKLIAYHLELWFSDNRLRIQQMTCQAFHPCLISACSFASGSVNSGGPCSKRPLLSSSCDTNSKVEPAERPSSLLDCCSALLCTSDTRPLS